MTAAVPASRFRASADDEFGDNLEDYAPDNASASGQLASALPARGARSRLNRQTRSSASTVDDAAFEEDKSQGRGGGKGRGRSAKVGRGGGSGGAAASLCFVCGIKKKANSRFCNIHHPVNEAILYQASRDGEMETYNDMAYDKERCERAIADKMQEDGSGQRLRKLIDWTQFRRDYGVRADKIDRTGFELMDLTDYTYH